MEIDNNFLDRFRDLIHEKLGIYISKQKDYLLRNKLNHLILKSNYKSTAELYYAVKNNQAEDVEKLIRYITTTHTFFYRESIHLKILRNDINLKKKKNPLIWCAACSTGEEVYSIIIELLECSITDFFIVATDINKDVLIHLKKGIYQKERLKKLPTHIIHKYFTKGQGNSENYYKVKNELKKFFIVKKINLVENLKFEKQFDYIFCRNVLIYFNRETQKKVIGTLLKNLDNLGYLFVGHSESLLAVTNKVETVFASVYNKKP